MILIADLARQHARMRQELDPVIADVLARGEFILGRRVVEFEEAFADFCGGRWGVGVNSGTSALHLALLAAGIGPGHEVITTAFSFVATAAAIQYTGARPVLVDIAPQSFNLDVERIEAAITPRTRAILPVHLYGHPADMDPILDIARRHGLVVIEDAAQAPGAFYKGRRVGSIGDAGCFSFSPTNNLGACGEAGTVVTSDQEILRGVRMLRDWGQAGPNCHVARGFNYRMEAIQGAVLGVKLKHLDEWNATRRQHAARYDTALDGSHVEPPRREPWARHVYYVYAVRAQHRGTVATELAARGIETCVHDPTPIHLIEALADLGYRPGDFPHAERAANEVLSVPVHPQLTAGEVAQVAKALCAVARGEAMRPAVLAGAR